MADEKKVSIDGKADVTGDVEGTVEVTAEATFTPGESKPTPESEFMQGMRGLFDQYDAATKNAGRETSKVAVAAPPAAFSRAGGVD